MRENTDQRKFRIWTLSKVVAIYHFQRIFIWLCKPSDLSIFFPSTSKSSFNGRSLLHVVTLLEQILTWKFPETRDSPSSWINYFQDHSLKNQNWAYLWINSLKFYRVCFRSMSSWGLTKYIETILNTFGFYLKSISASFSLWSLKKYIYLVE